MVITFRQTGAVTNHLGCLFCCYILLCFTTVIPRIITYLRVPDWFRGRRRRRCNHYLQAHADNQSWTCPCVPDVVWDLDTGKLYTGSKPVGGLKPILRYNRAIFSMWLGSIMPTTTALATPTNWATSLSCLKTCRAWPVALGDKIKFWKWEIWGEI